MRKKPKQKEKRPAVPLTAIKFERELGALIRQHKAGHLRDHEYNDKYVALVTRFRSNK